MMNRPRTTAATALAVILLSACASASRQNPFDAKPRAARGDVLSTSLIEIENLNHMTLSVGVVQAGSPIYLGRVGSLQRKSFRVPLSVFEMGGTYRVIVQNQRTGERFLTLPIIAERGHRVVMDLGSELLLTRYRVSQR